MRNRGVFIFVAGFVLAAAVGAVEPGDSLQEVLAEKGEPVGRMNSGALEVLRYADGSITLEDGKVVAVKAATATKGTPAKTPPKVVEQVAAKPRPAAAAVEARWMTNYAEAVALAKEQNRKLLLFFTGSDWCGWCKRLDREILSTADFAAYAEQQLVLVKLDFPRSFELPRDVLKQNEGLARKYRIRGYPTLVVLDPTAKSLGRLGYQEGGPLPFIQALQNM